MPAFAQQAGGMLTDAQSTHVSGIRRAGLSREFSARRASGHATKAQGDPKHGETVFTI